MKCEKCNIEHDGTYGSGRFCSEHCARSSACGDDNKRKEKNLKIGRSLKGNKFPKHRKENPKAGKKRKYSQETIRKRSLALIAINKAKRSRLPFEELDERWQKQILLEECGHKCTECGQGEEWNGKRLVLQIHHIDGDGKNRTKANSRIVCPNCHTQTDTWGNHGKKILDKERVV